MNAIRTENLIKKYGHITAIDQLSVAIEANQIYGFLGPDGAGKTSLFRIFCGILTATQGKVSVLGIDVRQSPEQLKPELGYMAQKFALYGDLTVKENLDFFADLFNTPRKGMEARKQELLQFANLFQFQDRLAGNLSGGMKQKLALCCTLIHTPKVLILDEPTTGVDPVSRQEFWEMLLPLPAQGTTVIVSTAYMDEASKCDRIAMMNYGKILKEGTPSELKQPLQGKIYEVRGEKLFDIQELLSRSVKDVQLFGDRLHVQLKPEMVSSGIKGDAEEGRRWLETVLTENGFHVNVAMVEPSLEDVFVDLLTA
ncbi:MAG TPA: multidrug ABC transporter ATP-binding protein [Firmicutes bacterium]|jgi:ABC-2 type transport system ATP-binding protein|nr:multidrug ABC transporter ATP-binding protein [Bacillota bacterium]